MADLNNIPWTVNQEVGGSARKVIRAKYDAFHPAYIFVEAKVAAMGADKYNFFEATSDGVNVQAGVGKPISFQTMGSWGPFHLKTMFPLTLLPGPISPMIDIPMPPLMPLLPKLGGLVGVFAALSMLV